VGMATLGFAGGPSVAFRIDPESIDWNWQIITNVVETIGGRVIQVIGAYLDDLVVTGSFGQDHSTPLGVSWLQAEAFLSLITQIMEFQSQDSNKQGMMQPPAIFTYPPLNYRFQVYVKDFADADGGGSIVMSPGKFNQRYVLTLFIVQDASEGLVVAGTTNGVYSQKQEAAIGAYMARISDGVDWHFSQYNGPAGASAPGAAKGGGKPGGGTGAAKGGAPVPGTHPRA